MCAESVCVCACVCVYVCVFATVCVRHEKGVGCSVTVVYLFIYNW